MRRAALVAAALALAACVPEEGPTMRPGQDCSACHGGDDDARAWTVSGTVYARADAAAEDGVQDAKVHLRDAGGRGLTLTSNEAGNFYTAEKLKFPLTVSVERGGVVVMMEEPVTSGSCNACHMLPPSGGAEGRVSLTSTGL